VILQKMEQFSAKKHRFDF